MQQTHAHCKLAQLARPMVPVYLLLPMYKCQHVSVSEKWKQSEKCIKTSDNMAHLMLQLQPEHIRRSYALRNQLSGMNFSLCELIDERF